MIKQRRRLVTLKAVRHIAIGIVLLMSFFSYTPLERRLLLSDSSIMHNVGADQGVALLQSYSKEEEAMKKNLGHGLLKQHSRNLGPPLIFNAGRGTTGTRSSFRTTCLAGLKSVHWQAYCYRPNNNKTNKATTSITQGNNNNNNKNQSIHVAWAKLQQDAMFHHIDLMHCVHNANSILCPQNVTMVEWKIKMEKALDKIIGSHNFQALHDSPYTHFAPYLLERAHSLKRRLIVIMNEREPKEWAMKRIGRTARGKPPGSPMCRDALQHQPQGHLETFPQDAFDVFGCIERGLARALEQSNNHTLSFSDLFISMNRLGRTKAGIQKVAEAMERYQNTMRNLSHYSFSVFERGGRVEDADLLTELQKNIPAWPNTTTTLTNHHQQQPMQRKVLPLPEKVPKKPKAMVKKKHTKRASTNQSVSQQ